MPMFYFDVLEIDGSTTRATEALEFNDPAAALLSARQAVCEMVLYDAPKVDHLHIAITVRGHGGAVLGQCGARFGYIRRANKNSLVFMSKRGTPD